MEPPWHRRLLCWPCVRASSLLHSLHSHHLFNSNYWSAVLAPTTQLHPPECFAICRRHQLRDRHPALHGNLQPIASPQPFSLLHLTNSTDSFRHRLLVLPLHQHQGCSSQVIKKVPLRNKFAPSLHLPFSPPITPQPKFSLSQLHPSCHPLSLLLPLPQVTRSFLF